MFIPLLLIWLALPVALFALSMYGVYHSTRGRGRTWMALIPIVLAVVVLNRSSNGPLAPWLRYMAAFGLPLSLAAPLVLPALPSSQYAQGRNVRRTLTFGWMAVCLSLVWTWYLLADPSSWLGHGGC